MGKYDKYWIAGGAIALLAGFMWWGQNTVDKASKTFAENLKLPFSGGVNVTMPNISVGLPSINLGISGLGDLMNSKQAQAVEAGVKNNVPGLNALWDLITNHQQSTIATVNAESTRLASANTNENRKAAIEAGTFFAGGIFAAADGLNPTSANRTDTSQGGNGIWVTDPKVQGGGYYIPDNSMYGKDGMPNVFATKPANASQEPFIPYIQSSADQKVIEANVKASSPLITGGWYIDPVTNSWRQR